MSQDVTNYAQFYTLLKRMPYAGDKEDLKKSLVLQGTNGRTDSLREVNKTEYVAILKTMEKACPNDRFREAWAEEMRHKRSICLKLMQQIGIDTTSWGIINKFCANTKIAGKEFRYLSAEELEQLSKKLRMILRKKQNEQQPI